MKLVKYLSNVKSESKFMDITGITDPKVIQRLCVYHKTLQKQQMKKLLDMANLIRSSYRI